MRRAPAVLLAAVAILCGCAGLHHIQERSSHGSLRVGAPIPSFAAVTETGQHFHSRDSWTNLTIYSVGQAHPDFSLDVAEDVSSLAVRKMGARIVRTRDGVVANLFGMKVAKEEPFEYDTTMVVICDTNCLVLRIWRSAGVEDLDELLKQLEVSRESSVSK